MLEEKVKYDEAGNIIEETVVNKAPEPNRQPANMGLQESGDPAAAANYELPEDLQWVVDKGQEALPPNNFVGQEVQTQKLGQSAPIDVTAIVPPQKPPVAVPLKPKEAPLNKAPTMPDIPKFNAEREGYESADKLIASAEADLAAPPIEPDPDEEIAQELGQEEEDAIKLSDAAEADTSTGLSLGERFFRAAMVFLGGVGLKAGQENQVFTYFMKSAEAAADRELKKMQARQKLQLTQYQEEILKIYRQEQALKAIEKANKAEEARKGESEKTARLKLAIATAYRRNQDAKNNATLKEINNRKVVQDDIKQEGLLPGKYKTSDLQKFGPAARELAIPIPSKKGQWIVATSKENAKAATEATIGFNSGMDYIGALVQQRKKWMDSGLLSERMSFSSEAKALRDTYKTEAIRLGQSLINSGVLNQGELEYFLKNIPYDFLTLRDDKFIGAIRGTIANLKQRYKAKMKILAPDANPNEMRSKTDYEYPAIDVVGKLKKKK
jgi:hypothetical protein